MPAEIGQLSQGNYYNSGIRDPVQDPEGAVGLDIESPGTREGDRGKFASENVDPERPEDE